MRKTKAFSGEDPVPPGGSAGSSKKTSTPLAVFLPLLAIYLAFSLFKVQQFRQLPNFDPGDDTALFWTESAFQYRYAKTIADGGTIPGLDTAAQYPEGARPHKEFTLCMEHVSGYAYRLLFRDSTTVPFHLFLIFFISFYSSLTIFAVYLLSGALWGSPGGGLLSVVFYLAARISWARTVTGFNYEDFALPLIFLSLALFIKAVKRGAGGGRALYSLFSALLLLAALSSWHFSRFYFLVFGSVLAAAFLTRDDCGESLRLPVAALLLVTALGGAFVPVLRATGLVFSSPVLLLSALLAASVLRDKFALSRPKTALLFSSLFILLAGSSYLFLIKDAGEYSHVYSLFLYKLKYLLAKPENPLLLPFDTRVLWIEEFNSPALRDWFAYLSILLPLGLTPALYGIYETRGTRCRAAFLFCGLAVSFFFLSFFAMRLLSFSAVFLAVYMGKYPELLERAAAWGKRTIYAFLSACFLLALASDMLAFSLKTPLSSPPTFYQGDTKLILNWIRANTRPDDVFLSNIGAGAAILAYTGRPVNLHPKFETGQLRKKFEGFARALYAPEEDFYKLCREYKAAYFLYENHFVLNSSRDSFRYFTGNLRLETGAAAYKFNFEPQRLKFFDLVYQTKTFRIYKLRLSARKAEPKDAWETAAYDPLYDPGVFSPGPAGKYFDDGTVLPASVKIRLHNDALEKGIGEMNAGNHDSARRLLLKALEILPDPFIYFYLGNVYSSLGDYDSAIKSYKLALNYSGDKKPELLSRLAAASAKKKAPAGAIKHN